jgi:hypothetical protein
MGLHYNDELYMHHCVYIYISLYIFIYHYIYTYIILMMRRKEMWARVLKLALIPPANGLLLVHFSATEPRPGRDPEEVNVFCTLI